MVRQDAHRLRIAVKKSGKNPLSRMVVTPDLNTGERPRPHASGIN